MIIINDYLASVLETREQSLGPTHLPSLDIVSILVKPSVPLDISSSKTYSLGLHPEAFLLNKYELDFNNIATHNLA